MNLIRKVEKAVKARLGDEGAAALLTWQERLEESKTAYQDVLAAMDGREELYGGTRAVTPSKSSRKAVAKEATNIRNIVFELIESQIDSSIPCPKVSCVRPEDERNAQMIEQILRADMDRLPMEYINDEQERTCPVQGGSAFLIEWDNVTSTHTSVGDISVTLLHPKQVIPQAGVRDLKKADYVFVQLSRTKQYIRQRFGVSVENETESNPEISGTGDSATGGGKVTQNIAYYRNDNGGIGMFTWVNDIALLHLEDYQTRVLEVCAQCGTVKTAARCACGSRSFRQEAQEYETLTEDITLPDGTVIPATVPALDENGVPTGEMAPNRIPYYKPNVFPIVLRKNVSVFGRFLGDSDVDKIRDQQEFVKKLGTKIEEKLLKGGSYLTLPNGVSFKKDDSELKVIQVRSAADTQAIGVMTLQPNISYDSAEKEKAYYEAKSTLGITDSFQGKPDATASSGVAKRIAIAQSAGRLESKRRMKNAFYAEVFEVMFRFKLAYSDEPRPYVSKNAMGRREYGAFDRYAFLRQDAAGEYYYTDQFLFSVDNSGSLAGNREGMWQETRMNFQQGAFGQPGSPEALILFWTLMEALHYPMASAIKAQIEQQQAQQQLMQQQAAGGMGAPTPGAPGVLPAGAAMPQGLPTGEAPAAPAAPAPAKGRKSIDEIISQLRGG